jgi:hypothetical protein
MFNDVSGFEDAQNLTACATQPQHHHAELFLDVVRTRPPLIAFSEDARWLSLVATLNISYQTLPNKVLDKATRPTETSRRPSFSWAIDLAR